MRHCRRRFSCLVGTIFQNTKLPQKWFILHKVCTLFAQCDTPSLEGEIEMDELSSCFALDREGLTHSVVRHGKKEYSKGKVTTNTIEDWPLQAHGVGTYHFVRNQEDALQV